MTREYPETVAGPYEPPPRTFTDGEDRRVAIHRYGADDAPVDDQRDALVAMYLDFDPEDRAQGIPPVGEEQIRTWLDSILAEECLNVLAWDDDRVVGHATLVPDTPDGGPDDAHELAIFVLSSYQGAGIGTQLIEALLGYGREAGIAHVWLTVERWNRPAIALYEKVGFDPSDDGGFELEMTASLR